MQVELVKVLIAFATFPFLLCASSHPPIVYWHSAGETCCETEFNTYSQIIKNQLGDDVYIKAVQIGSTIRSDRVRSVTTHPFRQIELACEMIKADEKLRNGYNALGFSQGALFLRALVQTCPDPPMMNLISMGGPHQGIHQYPRCGDNFGLKCSNIQLHISIYAYTSLSQRYFTPATYWHSMDESHYRAGSTFLALINNEKEINADYAKNLQTLKKFILVKYQEDVGIVPNESTWFGFYDLNAKPVRLDELELYKQDKLGLKAMKEGGKLIFLTAPLGHIKLDEPWFVQNIIPFLK